MKKYIFGKRNGIYIIDLQKTLKQFKEASKFVTDLAAAGKNLLFVGTKRQAQDAIYEEANRCGMFYVNTRWLGGTLTNFATIRKSIHRLKEIEGDPRAGRQREPHQEGAPAARAREGEAREEPRRASRRWTSCRTRSSSSTQAGVHRGQGGEQPRHPGRRRRRHQLRPGPDRPRDPGQRRRDPRHPALHGARSPTRCSRACTPTGSGEAEDAALPRTRPRTPELSHDGRRRRRVVETSSQRPGRRSRAVGS